MSSIHHDTTPDLKVVGTKLKDILEVRMPALLIMPRISSSEVLRFCKPMRFLTDFLFVRSLTRH